MKIKTSEATPLQINYLVAKCEGYVQDDERIGEVRDFLNRNTQYCELSDGHFVLIPF